MKVYSRKAGSENVLFTNRRGFMRLLAGGTAGALLAPVLMADTKTNNPGKKTSQISMSPALSAAGLAAAAAKASVTFPYKLPPLPYAYNALEPAIFERTMRIHHDKHHNGYTNKLNAALENYPKLQKWTLMDLLSKLNELPAEVRTAVRNNGGGYFNHALFWEMMTPNGGGMPKEGELDAAIKRDFGSFKSFNDKFSSAAKTLFGSGWAWLVVTGAGILGIDVWEHAYYLQYENRRGEYVDNFWSVINWDQCEKNFKA
jgi:Fe-Mn family superoxide dismutase